MAITSFKPYGIYRLFAYIFGLTKFKSIIFHAEYFELKLKTNSISIRYVDVLQKKLGGPFFKNFQLSCNAAQYVFRGLSRKDAARLKNQFEIAEENAWTVKLLQHKDELKVLSTWVSEIESRSLYQRASVFKSHITNARTLEVQFLGNIPSAVANLSEARALSQIRRFLKNIYHARENNNEEYIPLEIQRQQKLFDEIESNPLTYEQRQAVVTDEDANLVIASAGSGKTSVIVAKAAWLLEKGLRHPEEILLLAFAKDAQLEMEERLEKRVETSSESRLTVSTFHALGLRIIGTATGAQPTISNLAENKNNELEVFIRHTLATQLNDKKSYDLITKWFGEFFAPYESEFNFENQGQYWDYIRKNKIISLKDDFVKSFEECEIANFLYLNGINYLYEQDYKYKTAEAGRRQYLPDFYLPDYDIYIEHLGLKGFGRTAPFVDRKKYIKSLRWKRTLHRDHGTTLVETYSCEKSQGILTQRLREKLLEHSVQFKPVSGEEIFKVLNERKQIDDFTKLVTTFLGHYKGAQLLETDLRNRISKLEKKERYEAFFNVFMPIYKSYQEHLETEQKIDFHDIISEATDLIKTGKFENPYRYIMIDEFQDISSGRAKLLKELKNSDPDTQVFCVGDDWQAIYRFTGADINIMKSFEEHFGTSARSDLSKTFRCEEKITEHATHFILKNDFQIPKHVEAVRENLYDTVVISFRQSDEPKQIHSIVSMISEELLVEGDENNKTILVLGRYRNKIMSSFSKFDYFQLIKKLNQEFENLHISYKTMHGSKGLEADYVIILDHGFPSEKVDDPILNLVLAEPELYPNAEERRLFYVALTRAKEKVFIATQSGVRSSFIDEIIKSPFDFNVLGKALPHEPKCPKCIEGRLILREEYGFWSCSNRNRFDCEHKQEACPFCKKGIPLKLSGEELTCSVCEQAIVNCPKKSCDGFLQQKTNRKTGKSFWGCTNYFSKEKPCNYARDDLYEKEKPSKHKIRMYSRTNNSENSYHRKKYSNHGKLWTETENNKLVRLIKEGKSEHGIAEAMGRSLKSIQLQRERLEKLR